MVSSWCMGLLASIRSVFGLRRNSEFDDVELEVDDDDIELLDDTPPFESGTFDFEHDISRYFTAEFRIETATHDPERRSSLFAEYDVEDLEHWHRIQAEFQRWLESPGAKAKYRSPDDLMMARMSTTQTMTLADLGIVRVNLAPIEGVTLEQWAKVEAAVENGAQLRPLIVQLRIDPESWTKIAASWHKRMSEDVSGRIATEYLLHFGAQPA